MNDELITFFWAHVEKTVTCWNWIGHTDKNGLPIIRFGTSGKNFREYYPRRLSLQIDGTEPSKRVLPICKNKLCVNPVHLLTGDEPRFWNKVHRLTEPNGCWVWLAAQDKQGYGKFKIGGKDTRAHQYSWELFSGRHVPKGILVCHTCDHPYCVRPEHLFLGTCSENHLDRDMKGRGATAKLTVDQVKEIRELHQNGVTVKQLSNLYPVSYDAIREVVTRSSWRWA
jgi:hypothetical protein